MTHTLLSISVLAGVLVSGSAALAAPGNTIPDGSPLAPAGAPRSVFVNDPAEPGFGKDPFHPKSTRLTRIKVTTEDKDIPPPPDFPTELVLKGVSLVGGKKLAIINYLTVAEQEEFNIRVAGKQVKGQCVEIKEKSALLKVNGITRELPLRPGIQ
jgi:hypothetical protein